MLSPGSRILAVLGPTNTGKTHLAIERMLGHQSGMIGFPLRLLARENYDRIVKLKGARAVALITGEEKIVPPNPAYFVCTVESMPLDRPVDFLAVDEIQLCADPERGHVFTARLLHARGLNETMFLGADTVRPLMRRLVPEAEYIARPRFSTLTYTGLRKVTRLPPRSAVVAFAVSDVFALAELVRRQRGGTAVVLGALSPRARNAQVGMFQAGEVDYLVATDAIGMGLNMDVDHVAFAKLAKFDGRGPRRLNPAEIAQIAGRAGRHMSDGTFGTTADLDELEPEIVEQVENHRFDPLERLYWRNSRLRFDSLGALIRSLDERPTTFGLVQAREADDQIALQTLAKLPDIAGLARHPDSIRLLWEVCQIPDFRKVMSDTHARLLAQIYRHLMGPSAQLPLEWVAKQVSRLDRNDGDIDTLITRIAHIRTWTYIAHRSDWLAEAASWQERARAIEDRLSDALHDRLTQRFVDRRGALLARTLASPGELLAAVRASGEVLVEGHFVGRLDGFRFQPDAEAGGEEVKRLLAAANRVLRGEIAARARRLAASRDTSFRLTPDGTVLWSDGVVGRLLPGDSALAPRVEPLPGEFLEGDLREMVRRRLNRFLRDEIGRRLNPLFRAQQAELSGPARGLIYQLTEALGSVPAAAVAPQRLALDRADRQGLARLGIRLGTEFVYLDRLLKPDAIALRALLWSVQHGATLPPATPEPGRLAVPREGRSAEFCAAVGYFVLGTHAVRVDRVERLAAGARHLARQGPFAATPELAAAAGVSIDDLTSILPMLGYRAIVQESGVTFVPRKGRHQIRNGKRPKRVRPAPTPAPGEDNPFAKLRALRLAR
ncbi:MAG: disulfide oxidoreductase [Alphaproteobacteria bacterium]|nr:disulfide oxidoreductase [Alphaproteobacteria bacterium]